MSLAPLNVMCGRYTLTTDLIRIKSFFGVDELEKINWEPRYNIAPSQELPVILNAEGKRKLTLMRWGLTPEWAKEKRPHGFINARVESLASKPAFRDCFKSRRCIVPADSFYEWHRRGRQNVPNRILRKDRSLLGFAGIYEQGTFAIITTDSNDLVRPLHDRMPLILAGEALDRWLSPERLSPEELRALSAQSDRSKGLAEELELHPVSLLVNSPQNDSPECLEPFDDEEPQPDLFSKT